MPLTSVYSPDAIITLRWDPEAQKVNISPLLTLPSDAFSQRKKKQRKE